MGGDTAQVGDAFMRAQVNKIGSGYHVRLVNDSVTPTQTFTCSSARASPTAPSRRLA